MNRLRTRRCSAAFFCAAVLGAGLQTAQAAALPAVEAFARLPQIESVTLSPDGLSFAGIMGRGDDTLVVVRPVDGSGPLKAVMKTDNREQRFAWVRWVNDNRLVISLHFASRRGDTDTVETRLVAVDRDGAKSLTLAQPTAFANARTYAQIQDRVVDWLPEDGHHILLQAPIPGHDISPAVYRVDVDSGRRELVQGPRSHVMRWLSDGSHRVRVGVRQTGTAVEVLVCDPDGANWRTAWRYELFDDKAVEPLGFGSDPQRLFVLAAHAGHRAVHEVDLREPALALTLKLGYPDADVTGGLLRDPVSGAAVGVRGSHVGAAARGLWEPAMQGLAQAIDAALPGRYNRLLQFSADGSRYLLYSSGNGLPGQFMVGRRDRNELSLLGREYPELADTPLPRKAALSFVARDGLRVPGYLTLPVGAAAQSKLPTVVLAHGGPISRDTLDFDPLSSFLASRGYAVLQVNFRGSAGLGLDYRNAGLKRWGLEMQDDITDAVQALVQRGTADPDRICIAGASYGGYAALMGGAKTPDLYRCVVSLAGVTDLLDMARRQAHYVNGSEVFGKQVGSMWDDRQQLKETSPQRLAAAFKAPVLLVHGSDDRSVPYEQSWDMAKALQEAGKAVRLVQQDGGDHGLTFAAHRLQFYRELESFLAANLGPAAGSTVAAAPAR